MTLFLIYKFFIFYIIFSFFFILSLSKSITSSLLINRISSEWNEIKKNKLTFDYPFNTSDINEVNLIISTF